MSGLEGNALFERNLDVLAGRWPGLAAGVRRFASCEFAESRNGEGEPFFVMKRADDSWMALTDPGLSRVETDRMTALAEARLAGAAAGAPVLLAGLQNGRLAERLAAMCAGRARLLIALESGMVLGAWMKLGDRRELLAAPHVTLFSHQQPAGAFQRLTADAHGAQTPLVLGLLPAHLTEGLLKPLSDLMLNRRYADPAWQREHRRPTHGVLNGFRQADGTFLRYDIAARCVAIESYLKTGTIGPVYRKMQRIRRHAPEGSVLLEELSRRFEVLISDYVKRGYDFSHPITMMSNGHLVDGAHRLACAWYFRSPYVTVELGACTTMLPFDRAWFEPHFSVEELGAMDEVVQRLDAGWTDAAQGASMASGGAVSA